MNELSSYEKEQLCLLKEWVEKHEYKLTQQREEILLEFIENREKHLSAEDVYFRIKGKGIGISTVYRNIKLFTDLGILKEIKIEDKSFYELKMYAKKPLHIHMICEKCGRIKDIDDRDIVLKYVKMNKLIEEIYEAKIFDTDIIFHGLCKECHDSSSKNEYEKNSFKSIKGGEINAKI